VGSLLVIGPIDASQVEAGMPIVFQDPEIAGRLVTHRVVDRLPGSSVTFITQGDANATRDPFPVPARNVRGHVLWHITVLGSVMDFLQWPRSFLLLVVVPLVVMVFGEGWGRWRRARVAGLTPAVADGLIAVTNRDLSRLD